MAMMWIFLAVLALGVGVAVWAFAGSGSAGGAHAILAERLARGELSPEE